MDTIHYDYKLITESSCPSSEELNKFFSTRKFSLWKDHYYYTHILPTTKTLVEEAHSRLQQELSKHLDP
jgi:hypothetical protein